MSLDELKERAVEEASAFRKRLAGGTAWVFRLSRSHRSSVFERARNRSASWDSFFPDIVFNGQGLRAARSIQ